MLTRNCEATSLLREGDFNVRVTIFNKDPKSFTPEAYKAAWIETIRDSMGGMLVNSKETFKFHIQIAGAKGFQEITGVASNLISLLRSEAYPKPMSLRIDVVKSKNKMHSWIFIVDNSVEDKYLLPESEISDKLKYYLKQFGEEYSPYPIHTKKRQMYVLSLKRNYIYSTDPREISKQWIEMIKYGLKESMPELLFSSCTKVLVESYNVKKDVMNVHPIVDSGDLLDYLYLNYEYGSPALLRISKFSDNCKDKYIYFLTQIHDD